MLSSKNMLNILRQTRCISVLTRNMVMFPFPNYPSHFRTTKSYECCSTVCAVDSGITQFFRNYAKGKDKKKEKGSYKQMELFFFNCIY